MLCEQQNYAVKQQLLRDYLTRFDILQPTFSFFTHPNNLYIEEMLRRRRIMEHCLNDMPFTCGQQNRCRNYVAGGRLSVL